MADSRTKSGQICDTLRHRLRTGYVRPGARFYSNNSLARDFGISSPTASKILDELCAEGLVHRVNGSGTYVSETAIQAATACCAAVTWMDMSNPLTRSNLNYHMLRGLEQECQSHGLRSTLINLNDGDHLQTLDTILASGLIGLLILPFTSAPGLSEVLARVCRAGVPIVRWNESRPDLPEIVADRLGFDHRQVGQCAAEHLMALGHRRFGFIGYTDNPWWQEDRASGYRQALEAGGFELSARAIAQVDMANLRPSLLAAALDGVFAQGITALLAANDPLALELLLAAKALDRRCPADFSLVGVDNREEALFANLTTVDQPGELLAHHAFEMLLERRRDPSAPPRERLVACPLIVRRSTAAPPILP